MARNRTYILLSFVLLLAVGLGIVLFTPEAAPALAGPSPADAMPYPGSLTTPDGVPVPDGAYDFRFQLYNAATGGDPTWQEEQTGVPVRDGTFLVYLGGQSPLPADARSGGLAWLSVAVRGPGEGEHALLEPRQPLAGAVSASALGAATANGTTCPHDHWGEIWEQGSAIGAAGLMVKSTGSFWAIIGENTNLGGVLGDSDSSIGVRGQSKTKAGVSGEVSESGNGVEGISADASGSHGVYGEAKGEWGWASGVYGKAAKTHAIGVTGWHETNGNGVYAYSKNGVVLVAKGESGRLIEAWDTDPSDLRFYVSNTGHVRSDAGFHTPASDYAEMMDAVRGLDPGDVLVIGPDGRLRRSASPYTTTVAGIYSTQPGFVAGMPMEGTVTGKVPLAMMGVVPCKVVADNGPILPGDLLVTSATPGHAMRAENPASGTVLGKALSPLKTERGVIQVLVTLQ
jgi:hypothetical protein